MTPAPSTLHAMAHDEVTTPLVVLERPRVRVASRVVIVSGRSNPSPRDGHRESETARSGARGCRVTQTKLALSGGPGWRRERERQPHANPNANAKQGAASGMTQPIDDIDVIHTLDDSRSTSAFGVSG
jgi:hypothetical protein